jgi:hypothetical protein
MSESPRAQRVARRHQVNPQRHQVNQSASTSLRKSTTPQRELDPTGGPPLSQLTTGSTVSTLTTGNTDQTGLNDEDEDVDFVGGGGGGFDDDIGEEGIWEEEEEEVLLPPLKSVFQCGYVHQTQSGWECMWCGKSFVGRHSTRALHHVMKMTKNDVGVCSAAIPDKYLKRYEALFQCLSQRSAARKRSHEEKYDSVAISQDASVATLQQSMASW